MSNPDRDELLFVQGQLTSLQGQISSYLGGSGSPQPIPPTPIPPTPTPPTPPAGNYVNATYGGKGNYITLTYGPGTIVCLPLPGYSEKGRGTIGVDLSAGSAGFGSEICISKTPGLIDPNAGPYNYAKGGEHNTLKYDKAHTDGGQWYVNLRWTAPLGCSTWWNN